ncbi:hypothetical protein FNAPI_8696 [Fusarium napiforme]|uniref:Uncharacterized protein n=18 Tax=Fusarium TaxID=5506 RepID=A0A8H5J3B6_9HYPO|nr:hypothetical protein FNAPI_8696 [Fusarium napiforme]
MKKNDVIAIIIIILFIILAAVSFGIWKLVSMAKNHMSVTGSGTSSSHSSRDIADYLVNSSDISNTSLQENYYIQITTMADPSFLMPDLIEKVSKLNVDDLDTNKRTSNISRYQEFPYAHFYNFKNTRGPDGLKKTSTEYHERVRKALKALEGKYVEVYQDYQAWMNELILIIEKDDQHRWNSFIMDPRDYMEFGEGILEDLEIFPAHSNGHCPFPSHRSQDLFSQTVVKKRMQLAEIKKLIETGRRELARLEGSDSFVQLRNEFVKYHEEVAANCHFRNVSDESSGYASSSSERLIED